MLSAGEFFGEGCLAGQQLRRSTATAMTACILDKLEKPLMMRMLHGRHDISESFVEHLHADPTIVESASEGSVNPRLPFEQINNHKCSVSSGMAGCAILTRQVSSSELPPDPVQGIRPRCDAAKGYSI
jgi:hypothetical protein